ncbi:MAG TPA: class I SAM-dependent methyltransferase [Anaerolineales bacterium]|nr:class I SAM-dependent methyltransferase [Anaerolineales bacterium]
MTPHSLSSRRYLEKQYRDASNLDARVDLHARFSVNKYGWHRWVFDHFDLPRRCRILELGCGPGYLWRQNLDRLPSGWEISLSDLSAGMLETTRRILAGRGRFRFGVIDAQSIPCEEGYFEAVIANHMLYHVPDRPAALQEIRRVLKPGGRFYASSAGAQNLVEIKELIEKFDPALASWGRVTDPFSLENGAAQLSPWFERIELYRYEDALEVTEAAPLADYILSGWARQVIGDREAAFREFIASQLAALGGVMHITKAGGLFQTIRKGA